MQHFLSHSYKKNYEKSIFIYYGIVAEIIHKMQKVYTIPFIFFADPEKTATHAA